MSTRNIVQNIKLRKPVGLDPDALAARLEEAYLAQRRDPKFTQKFSFSPSSIGYYQGTCPRYWYHAFSGAMFVDKTDAQGVANMANGTAAHERVQTLFEQAGILVDKEVEVKMTNPPIRGFVDVLTRLDSGEIAVGEFKTTLEVGFLYRQSTMKPSAAHLIQILIYMKATGKKTGFVMYENKNTQEFIICPVEMDEKYEAIVEDVLTWLRTVHENWQAGQVEGEWENNLPKAPWTKRNKACRSCPVFDECWSNPVGTVKIPALELPVV